VPLRDGPEIQLFEIDLATRTERRVTMTPGNKHEGTWSADGRQIAFIADTEGTLQLWTQPAEGGEARQLTFGTERMRHATFSPDGRWIYVQPSHRNIWRVPTDGGDLQQVTTFPESGLFIEEPALAPDGRALVYARINGGGSIWLLKLAAGEPAP
jgi:TolB protein